MDSEWKYLIDEMFQSYLCEENGTSFYEPSSADLYPSIHESEILALDEGLLLEETSRDYVRELENWEPLDNLFDLLEEVVVADVQEKYEEKCISDLKSPSSEILKAKNHAKENKKKSTQDSATNTENKKNKSGKKRKREGNRKNSTEDCKQKKKEIQM